MRLLTLGKIKKEKPLVLVGLGNMGKAMLKGWRRNGLSGDAVKIISPNAPNYAELFPDVDPEAFLTEFEMLPTNIEPLAVVLAVKPQKMDEILPLCGRFLGANPLFLSVAAGKSLGYFAGQLGQQVQIVRAMPNTPASIGLGMTAAVANGNVTDDNKEFCAALLEAVGMFEWLDQEDLMDAVTAVSGSGPAYIFLLAESLTKAAMKQGLPKKTARKLAYQTIMGAASLLDSESAKDSEDSDKLTATRLREQVTSPNGTTAAALSVLMNEENGMPEMMNNAVQRATERSRELNRPSDVIIEVLGKHKID